MMVLMKLDKNPDVFFMIKETKVKIEGKEVNLYITEDHEVFSDKNSAEIKQEVYENFVNEYELKKYPEEEKLTYSEVNSENIPHGAYCYKDKTCPYWDYIGVRIFHKNLKAAEEIAKAFKNDSKNLGKQVVAEVCKCAKTCDKQCWSEEGTSCKSRIVGCKYLNIIDENESTLLWDQCKECEVNRD